MVLRSEVLAENVRSSAKVLGGGVAGFSRRLRQRFETTSFSCDNPRPPTREEGCRGTATPTFQILECAQVALQAALRGSETSKFLPECMRVVARAAYRQTGASFENVYVRRATPLTHTITSWWECLRLNVIPYQREVTERRLLR